MRSYLISLLLCWSLCLSGQEYFFSQNELSTDLLRLNPTKIYRYKNNLLLIATKEGIVTYDGHKHEILLRNENGSQNATYFHHDGKQLWIGYEDGAILLLNGTQLSSPNLHENLPTSKITGIAKDTLDQLWVSTYGQGLFVYGDKQFYHFTEENGLLSNDIYTIVKLPNHKILAATDDGILQFSIKAGKIIVDKIKFDQQLDHDIITNMKVDTDQTTVIASTFEDGIWKIPSDLSKAEKLNLPTDNIKLYTSDSSKIICLPAANQNELLVQSKSGISNILISGLQSELAVIDIFLDNENLLWLLCKNNGLISSPTNFKINPVNIKNIQTLMDTEAGTYIGNENGLYLFGKDHSTKTILKNQNVLTVYFHQPTKKLWVGTFGNGIFILDHNNSVVSNLNELNGLANNNVFSIVNHRNSIWASTLAGVNQIEYDEKVIKKLDKKNGLPTDYNYTLFSDSKENLWVGTDGQGMIKIDKKNKITHFKNDHTIIDFAEDKNQNIWFCTLNNGLGIINKDSVRYLTLDHGLTEIHISGIISDKKGNMLSFHHTGIDVINVQTLSVNCIGNNIGIRKWKNNIHTVSKAQNGNILVAENGNIIELTSLDEPFVQPTLYIYQNICGKVDINQSKVNILSHDDNDFLIEYSGIWMSQPENVSYRYKMGNLDTEWRYTKDQKLIYPNLPPGKYNFILQCSTNNHYNNAVSYEISLEIKQVFWKTWWFGFIVLISIISGLYFTIESRNKRKKELQDLYTEQIKSQLEILKSQINPHFLFNSFNTLISTIELHPEKAVTFVEKLSDFYRNMLSFRDKELISLEDELLILDNYIFLLKERFRDNIQIIVETDNTTEYKIIPLTLQILAENAVKHNIVSQSKPLELTIKIEKKLLVVCNNIQLRSNVEKSTNFGLESLKKRYLAITGISLKIETYKNIFCVTIPLIIEK